MGELGTLKETLEAILKRGKCFGIGLGLLPDDVDDNLTEEDRAYLNNWIEGYADDPIWTKIFAATRLYGPIGAQKRSYSSFVCNALHVNRISESMRSGDDPVLVRRRSQRNETLDMADKADALARYLHTLEDYSGLVDHFQRFLRPLPELVELNQQLAEFLRSHAGKEPTPTTVPIRQDRRQGRSGLRKRRVFICQMSETLVESVYSEEPLSGFTHVQAVAAFARIAFPEVGEEEVRKTLAPTTREGRRNRSRTRQAGAPTSAPTVFNAPVEPRPQATGFAHSDEQ
jgi:hypothetical protein